MELSENETEKYSSSLRVLQKKIEVTLDADQSSSDDTDSQYEHFGIRRKISLDLLGL